MLQNNCPMEVEWLMETNLRQKNGSSVEVFEMLNFSPLFLF